MNEGGLVENGQVVSMDYKLTVAGEVIDASSEGNPLQFIQGVGMIIPGLEKELYGMAVGEAKDVVVKPGEGYGELDPQAVVDIDRQRFPPNVSLVLGNEMQMRTQDGRILTAVVVGLGDETVKLDFNHPLAGQELAFAVKIIGLRAASAEEKASRTIANAA